MAGKVRAKPAAEKDRIMGDADEDSDVIVTSSSRNPVKKPRLEEVQKRKHGQRNGADQGTPAMSASNESGKR